MTRTPGRAWRFVRRPRVEQEVGDELAFHVDMTIQMLIAEGMTPATARAEAVRRFGDMAVVAAECRHFAHQRDDRSARVEYLGELKQDVVFALRQLRRARGFTTTAMLTLALGIGATAAVFSALYAVVLQPLPFRDAGRVVRIFPVRRGNVERIVSGAELAALRARRDAFVAVAGARLGGGYTLTGTGIPEVIEGASVTAEFFRVLGVAPAIGRGFLDSDDLPGAPRVALVSHRVWTRRFGADTALVGRTLQLGGEPHTVIGVMPAALDRTGAQQDLWTPLRLTPAQLSGSGGAWMNVFARLAPGVTVAQATDAARAAEQVAMTHAMVDPRNVSAEVRRYIDVAVGDSRQRLLVLLGAAGFVLLIAGVNVANLLLARGTTRARELAIRAALGAGRARLVRQLIAESLVLALGGAIAGGLIAYLLVKSFVALAPDNVTRLDQAQVNGVVLAFTLGIALVASILAGLVPARRAATPALQSTLREGGRGVGSGAASGRLRSMLVVAEVALATTLLTGSGLLIQSAWRLHNVDLGFQPSHVMTARVLLPAPRYPDGARIRRAFEQIQAATERVPGVRRVALVSIVPLSGSSMTTHVFPEDRPLVGDDRIGVDIRYSSPGYFATMGMPVLDGRDFTRDDGADAAQVAVISMSLAKKLWPGGHAVGRRIDGLRISRDLPNLLTVVGVVADTRDEALNAPAASSMYMPVTQVQEGMWEPLGHSLVLAIQTAPAPETVLAAVRRAVMAVDASVPLTDEHTMDGWVSASVAAARFNMILLSTLGALALVLASVGVYGVMAYFVGQRTREIGVRMALGAAPLHIWRLVLGRGLRPIGVGVLVGVALSLATARLLHDQLYGVGAGDPTTFGTAVVVLVTVAVLAMLVPARRAMRVTPLTALAAE